MSSNNTDETPIAYTTTHTRVSTIPDSTTLPSETTITSSAVDTITVRSNVDYTKESSVVVSTTSSVDDAMIATESSAPDTVISSSSVKDAIITTDPSSPDTVIVSSSTTDIKMPTEFTPTFHRLLLIARPPLLHPHRYQQPDIDLPLVILPVIQLRLL